VSEEARRSEQNDETTGRKKKPYQKPAFRREKVFETRALSCGKVSVTQSQCVHNRRNS
jgi:hypothetical protein